MVKWRYGLLVAMSSVLLARADSDDLSETDSSSEYGSHDTSFSDKPEAHEESVHTPEELAPPEKDHISEKPATPAEEHVPGETHISEDIHQPPSLPSLVAPSTAAVSESSSSADDWQVHGSVRQSEFRGNWLKKRLIRKNASALYEKIHDIVSRDWEKQYKDFSDALSDTLKTMQQRRQLLYLNEADLAYVQEHIDQVIQYKQEQAKLKKSDTKASPVTYDSAAYAMQLEELREALKALDEPKAAAEGVAATIQQQRPLGASYEQQAWQQYEAIDAAYDDRRAEEIFLTMEAAYEHLQEMLRYVQQELTPYTQRLAALFDERLSKLQSVRDAVLKEGIPLRPSEVEALKPAPILQKPKEDGWIGMTLEYIASPFVWLWSKGKGLVSSR